MKNLHKTPTCVELFSGAGLFSAAFSQHFSCLLAIEIDPDAVTSYRRNVGREVENRCVKQVASDVRCDVLLAGPPCQGFSSLGRRNPNDERNSLCQVIPTWAEATNAAVVVVENVPQFIGTSHWKTMTASLRKLGFTTDVWTLNAVDFGAPQRRLRSFTISSRVGQIPQPRPTHRDSPVTVREAFTKPIQTHDTMHSWPAHSELSMQRIKFVPPGGGKRDLVERAPHLCAASWFNLIDQATDVFGRLSWDEPANTIKCEFQNPSKGRYIHPKENRTISLREGARLQGIPDDWVFAGTKGSIASQIGNGVPLPLGRAVARAISKVIC